MPFFPPSLSRRAAAAVLALFVIWAPTVASAAGGPGPASFADLAAKLLPSVVNISSSQSLKIERPQRGPEERMPKFPPGSPFEEFFKHFFDHGLPQRGGRQAVPQRTTSLGSGFIVDPAGYIVTNNHVIAHADDITVILHDNTNLKAKVIGRDPKTDIALLKVDAGKPLPAVTWGDSDKARVGDWVLAIGNPFGLGGTVTAGIISARQRDINSGPYDDYLQTDAPINRGNSGGPMFNMEGQVIGINTAIYSPSGGSIGIGFAIPSALARTVVEQLRNEPDHTVHRGWLGVRIQTVTDEIAETLGLPKAHGALVASVNEGGPAKAAGIEPGDVILRFDGKSVSDMRFLPRLVAETPVDKTVPVTVWRKGRERTIKVKIGRLKEKEPKLAEAEKKSEKSSPEVATTKALGLSMAAINPALREKFSLAQDAKGVVITAVDQKSQAAAKGVRPGDVVIEAAQEAVKSPDEVASRVAAAKKAGRKSILLLVDRRGDLRFVALRLDRS